METKNAPARKGKKTKAEDLIPDARPNDSRVPGVMFQNGAAVSRAQTDREVAEVLGRLLKVTNSEVFMLGLIGGDSISNEAATLLNDLPKLIKGLVDDRSYLAREYLAKKEAVSTAEDELGRVVNVLDSAHDEIRELTAKLAAAEKRMASMGTIPEGSTVVPDDILLALTPVSGLAGAAANGASPAAIVTKAADGAARTARAARSWWDIDSAFIDGLQSHLAEQQVVLIAEVIVAKHHGDDHELNPRELITRALELDHREFFRQLAADYDRVGALACGNLEHERSVLRDSNLMLIDTERGPGWLLPVNTIGVAAIRSKKRGQADRVRVLHARQEQTPVPFAVRLRLNEGSKEEALVARGIEDHGDHMVVEAYNPDAKGSAWVNYEIWPSHGGRIIGVQTGLIPLPPQDRWDTSDPAAMVANGLAITGLGRVNDEFVNRLLARGDFSGMPIQGSADPIGQGCNSMLMWLDDRSAVENALIVRLLRRL